MKNFALALAYFLYEYYSELTDAAQRTWVIESDQVLSYQFWKERNQYLLLEEKMWQATQE